MSQIVWWEIETPDPETFQAFHGAMWGWTFERAFEGTELAADYWIIQAGGQGIGGLQRAASATPPHPGARLYVEVDDLEAILAAVEVRGGRVERRRTASAGTTAGTGRRRTRPGSASGCGPRTLVVDPGAQQPPVVGHELLVLMQGKRPTDLRPSAQKASSTHRQK